LLTKKPEKKGENMRKYHLILLVLAGLIITGPTMAIAEPDAIMGDHGKTGLSPLSRIDLSNKQTEQIRKIRVTYEKSISALRLQEHQLKAELNIFWLQMSPDIEKIKSVQKQIHDIRFQIMEKETEYYFAVREILTKDQLSRFLVLGGDRWYNPEKQNHLPPPPRQPMAY
jgi:Spy/CpxP family protein refolding chaperone